MGEILEHTQHGLNGNPSQKRCGFRYRWGTWLKGKEETVALHKKNHATIFKTSTWTIDSVAIKYVKPDLAILHIKWGIKGDFDPDGPPRKPRHGVFT